MTGYNVDFELASFVYMVIICIYFQALYPAESRVNRTFRGLLWITLITNLADVTSSVCMNHGTDVYPIWLIVVLSIIYFYAAALMGYQFVCYIRACVYNKDDKPKDLPVSFGIQLVYGLILISGYWTGWVFYLNETGEYFHGPLYLLVYIVPLYYMIRGVLLMISHKEAFQRGQRISVFVFAILAELGPALQLFFFPNVLLSVFSMTLGVVAMMFALETPDYHRLMKTMEELKRTQEEAEQAKEQAQEANQAKTEFLSNMSHEIRTPIHAILGYNEMIMQEMDEGHATAYAVNIQAAGRTLLSMVNDVLDYTKMDEGSFSLQAGPYATLSMLQDIITYAEYNAEKKQLELRVSIDQKLPRQLSGDMTRLMQIINNLLSNAVKYTNEGYVLFQIEWEPQGEEQGVLTVQVTDSGIGMHEDDIRKVTESFSRVDRRNTCNIQGMGLGLTIVTKLLGMMGAELEIESEYGKGSTFRFCITQKIVDVEPIGELKREKLQGKLWQNRTANSFVAPDVRLLVVDDNEMNLELFKGVLRKTKIQIDTAMGGKEALQMLGKQSYHAVFLDQMMPAMDGIATLHEIRRRGLCPDVPIIAFTANAVAGERENYLREGFDDFLSKPIIMSQLEEVLRHCLPKEMLRSVVQETGKTEPVPDDVQRQPEKTSGLLSRLSFLDTKTGLSYCSEDEDFYREMLESYLENNKVNEIEKAYTNQCWKEYQTLVHALKSTSLSIGATRLSDQAKKLEYAARDEEISYIDAYHASCIQDYQQLMTKLSAALQKTEAGQAEAEAMAQTLPEKAHILVVDDDIMNLRIAERILKEKYMVTLAKSGEAALEALETIYPQLILLDLHMKGIGGFEVMERMKENMKYRDIPVVLLTSDDDRKAELRGFREGAQDFVKKPFVGDVLLHRVGRILEMERLRNYYQQDEEKQGVTVGE